MLKNIKPAKFVKGLHSKAKAEAGHSEGVITGPLQASGFKNPLYQFDTELSPATDISVVAVSFVALHPARCFICAVCTGISLHIRELPDSNNLSGLCMSF